jgi:hypothetical protein
MAIDMGPKPIDDPLNAGARAQSRVNVNDFKQLAALRLFTSE